MPRESRAAIGCIARQRLHGAWALKHPMLGLLAELACASTGAAAPPCPDSLLWRSGVSCCGHGDSAGTCGRLSGTLITGEDGGPMVATPSSPFCLLGHLSAAAAPCRRQSSTQSALLPASFSRDHHNFKVGVGSCGNVMSVPCCVADAAPAAAPRLPIFWAHSGSAALGTHPQAPQRWWGTPRPDWQAAGMNHACLRPAAAGSRRSACNAAPSGGSSSCQRHQSAHYTHRPHLL